MQFEIDVFWVVVGGQDPVELIDKLEGRVSQLTLKDLKTGTSAPNFGVLRTDAFKERGAGILGQAR